MSGVAGAERIKSREDFSQFIKSYSNVISKFPGFVSITPSGSYVSNLSKQDFGDIDLITHIQSFKDKATIKKELAEYLLSLPANIIVPFESAKYKGKRVYNSGEIISVRFYDKQLGYSAQIDNVIALDKEEANFKENFLNLPAEKQGIILGLVKVATLETDPKILFQKLGIKTKLDIEDNQEYTFNLSSSELQLRLITYKPSSYEEENREIVWRSKDFFNIEKLLPQFDLEVPFEDLLQQANSKLKNPRSKKRVAGLFSSMISIKSGEIGTEKGATKQKALDVISKKFLGETFKDFYNKKVVITFGRFNPPTRGHELLINKVKIIAKSNGAEAKIYLSHTVNKKNPLPYADKVNFLTKWFGSVIVDDISSENRTVFDALRNLGVKGYVDATLVVGSDRVAEFEKVIRPYINNDKDNSINIQNFKVISAGQRDADDLESVAGISGTKMREFISNDDFKSFKKWLPSKATDEDAEKVWNLAKRGLVESQTFEEFYNDI